MRTRLIDPSPLAFRRGSACGLQNPINFYRELNNQYSVISYIYSFIETAYKKATLSYIKHQIVAQ